MQRAVHAAGWHVPHVALRVQTPDRLIFSMVTCYAREYFSRIRALHGMALAMVPAGCSIGLLKKSFRAPVF
jgi:hypothetical protein